jgi:hypothetical protein
MLVGLKLSYRTLTYAFCRVRTHDLSPRRLVFWIRLLRSSPHDLTRRTRRSNSYCGRTQYGDAFTFSLVSISQHLKDV